MRLLPLFAIAGLAAGCSHDTTPSLAFDPIWIEPDGVDIHGFQTWEVFTERWSRSYNEKFYVCAVVVEFDGVPATAGDDCPGCDLAWDVTPTLLETDCAAAVADEAGFLSLRRIALGDVGNALQDDNPHPGDAGGGYADYGTDSWEPYGWAYPETLDTRGQAESAEWDGAQPFQLWPAFYWELGA